MKSIKSMSLGELAAYVCSHLEKNGIHVVLSGGACVSIHSQNEYTSYDLDFIENISSPRNRIKKIMAEIDFLEENRYFKHPDTEFFIEFPSGPLAVGREPAKEIISILFPTGNLKILSPTDCVKDRLSAYYYWQDNQSLEQACLVAKNHILDLTEIRRWSKKEEELEKYREIEPLLKGSMKSN